MIDTLSSINNHQTIVNECRYLSIILNEVKTINKGMLFQIGI